MNRRDLLQTIVGAVVAGCVLPKRMLAMLRPSSRLTIANIVVTAFPEVRKIRLAGHNWVSLDLQRAELDGRVVVQPLGVCVIDGCDGSHNNVMEMKIPMVWAPADNHISELDKIDLVTSMFNNVFESHDDLFLEMLGTGRAVASTEYRYRLGIPHEITYNGECTGHVVKLYTAAAFLKAQR